MPQQLSTNTFTTAKWIVSALASDGTHTTIQAAINSASSGDTIFIRPGTYTENPALKSGVDLVAFVTDGDIPNVIINGACTYSSAGTVGISGIELQTNSGFLLAVTGSAASVVYIIDSYINCLNNTGISFSSSSPASAINLVNCSGNIGTTGIGIYSSSSAGGINFEYTTFSNTGGSTTASTNSAGTVGFSYSSTFSPISISGGTLVFDGGFINTTTQNVTCLALTGSSVVAIHLDSGFASGTASAISIGVGSTLTNYSMMEISSTNTNAITGAGTIQYGNIVYGASSSTNNVTTQIGLPQSTGILSLPASSLTEYGVLFSNSTTGLIASTAAGSSGQVLTSNGSSAPTFQAVPASSVVVQQIRANKTAAQTITSTIAAITTTPTTSTGASIISVSITPTNSSHILLVEAVMVACSAGNSVAGYIIQNAAGNSIATSWSYASGADVPLTMPIQYYATAGGTSAITFALYGTTVGADTYVNSNTSGTQLSGGTAFTSLTVTEYTS